MSSIVIAGDTSGSVTLQAPAVAGSTVLNLPSTSGTIQTSGAGYTTNGVAYATSTSALATGSALTFDGANNFLLDATGTGGNQANLRVKTDTGGAVANGYFNINGTDYFRIYTTNSETGLRNLQNTPMFFSINNTEQMRLTSTGLGIGTSSPVVKLDVYGSGAYLAQFIRSTSGVAGGGITIGNQSRTCTMFTDSAGWSVYDNTAAAQRMLLDSAGNLGLGVTPSAWYSTVKAFQFGAGGLLDGRTNDAAQATIGAGYYLDSGATYRYISTNGATRFVQASGAYLWFTAASGTAGNAISFTQAMTLDASGNLLVGLTSSTARLHVDGGDANISRTSGNSRLLVTATGVANTALGFNNSGSAATGMPNNVGYLNVIQAYPLVFGTDSTERARITSTGNLLVGTTSAGFSNSNAITIQAAEGYCVLNHANGTGSGTNYIWFGYNAGSIGTISQNGTTAVAYNTSSDYRLKNNIAPMTGALEKVALLKPCTYKWNVDNSDGEGFIAHELAEVCPHAVNGEKDAVETYVDEDGNEQTRPVYQGIDTSFLVATLTAAIQEQQALITTLTDRITALEGV